MLCYNRASPRSIFITWLAILNRLYTTDRMQNWGLNCSDDCVLCSGGKESVEHLFFACSFSATIWQAVLKKLGIHRRSAGLAYELGEAAKASKKTGCIAKLYVMCFTETIYSIWLMRNSVVFRNHVKSSEYLVKEILFRVACRSSDELRSRLLQD
ncbi:uncharacterized protein [Spinacia oleracea]|uniref:Reverse transcriptase zinc-binding domain-containing protein n=1 Tax=Spinacia oleracea TaxID=3562 RepID=A0ABM3REX2_SPIOL|nr:uncharacterized protein LOC130469228 [Spinacia oleracea]